ncbi:MAG: tyrosine-protein phosphatase [Candidatus Obscuribacterales bacterium]|nr:tyrosine-protein phosphatase [Candidatus Obscuribacterales bacterium]
MKQASVISRRAKRTGVFLSGLLLAFSPATFSAQTEQSDAFDLRNFHQVNDYLYRGGMPTPEGIKKLKKLGVTTIVDLCEDPLDIALERHVAVVEGIKYINLPTGDFAPRPEKLAKFVYTVDQAERAHKQGKPGAVFVHCHAGSDRTGFYLAVWRVINQGWRIDLAFLEMLRYGFMIHKLDFPVVSEASKILAEQAKSSAKSGARVSAASRGESTAR